MKETKPKVYVHGSYVGTTGYNQHTRDFFRELSKQLQLKVRNFTIGKTWDGFNEYPHNNEPYIITLSYGYDKVKNCLYFHTAKKGLKMEILKKNPLVCGTIIEDLGYKYNECSHAYRSVVFWGKITIIKDLEEMKYAFNVLLSHLEENVISLRNRLLSNDQIFSDVCLLRLDIQWITGKGSN